eukprot:TRINITY_DN9492_c0_g1_i2.p1 TRINITY_DN9492_c0_g1~~TRINITY_DN9492_c0_g1_i2.p1  ORF type:complete len:1338 (+),score=351.74 TRINITY_DN9492_c0_g1_i2:397-4410(+)
MRGGVVEGGPNLALRRSGGRSAWSFGDLGAKADCGAAAAACGEMQPFADGRGCGGAPRWNSCNSLPISKAPSNASFCREFVNSSPTAAPVTMTSPATALAPTPAAIDGGICTSLALPYLGGRRRDASASGPVGGSGSVSGSVDGASVGGASGCGGAAAREPLPAQSPEQKPSTTQQTVVSHFNELVEAVATAEAESVAMCSGVNTAASPAMGAVTAAPPMVAEDTRHRLYGWNRNAPSPGDVSGTASIKSPSGPGGRMLAETTARCSSLSPTATPGAFAETPGVPSANGSLHSSAWLSELVSRSARAVATTQSNERTSPSASLPLVQKFEEMVPWAGPPATSFSTGLTPYPYGVLSARLPDTSIDVSLPPLPPVPPELTARIEALETSTQLRLQQLKAEIPGAGSSDSLVEGVHKAHLVSVHAEWRERLIEVEARAEMQEAAMARRAMEEVSIERERYSVEMRRELDSMRASHDKLQASKLEQHSRAVAEHRNTAAAELEFARSEHAATTETERERLRALHGQELLEAAAKHRDDLREVREAERRSREEEVRRRTDIELEKGRLDEDLRKIKLAHGEVEADKQRIRAELERVKAAMSAEQLAHEETKRAHSDVQATLDRTLFDKQELDAAREAEIRARQDVERRHRDVEEERRQLHSNHARVAELLSVEQKAREEMERRHQEVEGRTTLLNEHRCQLESAIEVERSSAEALSRRHMEVDEEKKKLFSDMVQLKTDIDTERRLREEAERRHREIELSYEELQHQHRKEREVAVAEGERELADHRRAVASDTERLLAEHRRASEEEREQLLALHADALEEERERLRGQHGEHLKIVSSNHGEEARRLEEKHVEADALRHEVERRHQEVEADKARISAELVRVKAAEEAERQAHEETRQLHAKAESAAQQERHDREALRKDHAAEIEARQEWERRHQAVEEEKGHLHTDHARLSQLLQAEQAAREEFSQKHLSVEKDLLLLKRHKEELEFAQEGERNAALDLERRHQALQQEQARLKTDVERLNADRDAERTAREQAELKHRQIEEEVRRLRNEKEVEVTQARAEHLSLRDRNVQLESVLDDERRRHQDLAHERELHIQTKAHLEEHRKRIADHQTERERILQEFADERAGHLMRHKELDGQHGRSKQEIEQLRAYVRELEQRLEVVTAERDAAFSKGAGSNNEQDRNAIEEMRHERDQLREDVEHLRATVELRVAGEKDLRSALDAESVQLSHVVRDLTEARRRSVELKGKFEVADKELTNLRLHVSTLTAERDGLQARMVMLQNGAAQARASFAAAAARGSFMAKPVTSYMEAQREVHVSLIEEDDSEDDSEFDSTAG